MGGVRCARVSAAWLGRGAGGGPRCCLTIRTNLAAFPPAGPGRRSAQPGYFREGGGPLPRTHARTAFHACRPPYFPSSGFLESREGPPYLGGACARGCGKVGEVAEVGVFTCWDAPGPPMTETNSCLQGARSLVGSCSALCP